MEEAVRLMMETIRPKILLSPRAVNRKLGLGLFTFIFLLAEREFESASDLTKGFEGSCSFIDEPSPF